MTSDTRTAIQMPGIMAGMWLDSLGNTDAACFPKLMHHFPSHAEIDETSTAESLRPGLVEQRAVLWLTAAAPTQLRGRELFVYNVDEARSVSGSPRIIWTPHLGFRQVAREGSQELLRSFGSTSAVATTPKFVSSELQPAPFENVTDLLVTMSATSPKWNLTADLRFETAFQRANEELFEDGMESEFTKQLRSLVGMYGFESTAILTRLLENKHVSPEVWAEAMRWIGRAESSIPRENRLWLLGRVGHWFEVISPAAPRQTVHAVFPHTAFRLPSFGSFMALQGGRTGSGCQRLRRGYTA
jgi:hypothetical protein